MGRFTSILVWAVWALSTMGAAIIVWRQGVRLPWSDDWNMVPFIAGARPVTIEWLWSPHNEHRILFPKIIFVLVGRLSGGDFRWAILFNLAALSAAALLLLRLVQKKRGYPKLLDAFIPLAMLHFGQGGLAWGFQFQFVSATTLICTLLAVLLWQGAELTVWAAIIAGAIVCLLPLCGGNGLLYVPLVAAWLCVRDRIHRHVGPPPAIRCARKWLIGAVLVAGILSVMYFRNYTKIAHPWPQSTLLRTLGTTVHVLASSFGPIADRFWPWSGLMMLILITIILGSLARIIFSADSDISEKISALDLAVFQGATLVVALGVGYGRAGRMWESGLSMHYSSLALPCLMVAWLASELKGGKWIQVYQFGLFALVGTISIFYLGQATASGSPGITLSATQRDLLAGRPARVIAEEHVAQLFYTDSPEARALIETGIRELRHAGFTRFGPAHAP